jgi:ABC-2 type transport system permease protein
MSFVSDTLLIFRRQMRFVRRDPTYLIVVMIQPVIYLLLFGPLLTGLPPGLLTGGHGAGGTATAYRFFIPGLLIQLALIGSLFVGFGLLSDLRAGVIERFRVTPLSRVAVLAGRVMRDVIALIVQAFLLLGAGLALGLRAPAGAIVMSFVFIVLVTIGLAAASYAAALLLKSEDAFSPLINTLLMPLILLSGVLLPMSLGPRWLQALSGFSPYRHIIDAMRESFDGHYLTLVVAGGLAVAVVTALAFFLFSALVFDRENE